jgi:predicted RNA-binding protein associated with RNAse of E/G family
LRDKNTGKKIKLGTYSWKGTAEDDAGGMYGFQTEGHMSTDGYRIIYFTRRGNKRITLKEFDTREEMQKYYAKLEISIEEVRK